MNKSSYLKQRSDLFKSIMSDPKLSKTFKEAMAAPIGSTKRQQAKSVLSIMRKMSRSQNDGRGGLLTTGTGLTNFNFNEPLAPLTHSTSTLSGVSGGTMVFPQVTPKTSIFQKLTLPAPKPTAPKVAPISTGNYSTTPFNFLPASSPWNQPSFNLPSYNTLTDLSKLNLPQNLQNMSLQPTKTQTESPFSQLKLSPSTTAEQDKWFVEGKKTQVPILTQPGTATSKTQVPILTKRDVPMPLIPKTPSSSGEVPKKTAIETLFGPVSGLGETIGTIAETAANRVGEITGAVSLGTVTGEPNLAAKSIASILSRTIPGVTPQTPFTEDLIIPIAKAIVENEGFLNGTSRIAIEHNNPGNLKFAWQKNAVQGEPASDDGYYAKFDTLESGSQALLNDLTAKFNRGEYPTIEALMRAYSPNEGAPGVSGAMGTISGQGVLGRAQGAIDTSMGPGFFAMQEAENMFEGGFDNFIKNLRDVINTKHNLTPLEDELSRLKSMRGDLVPTLQQYIVGRDQYLRFIDDLINQTESNFLKQDMSNPAVAQSYRGYMSYLYTLQGRQEQRYGNFLESSIAQYNAEVEQAQDNYENTYKRYAEELKLEVGLAENKYNMLFSAFSDLYKTMEDAPMKQASLMALELSNLERAYKMAEIVEGMDRVFDEDYQKNVKSFLNQITDKDGFVDLTTFSAPKTIRDSNGSIIGYSGGLIEYFKETDLMGIGEDAPAKAIKIAINRAIEKKDMSTVIQVAEMLRQLALTGEGGQQRADLIVDAFEPLTAPGGLLSTYVLDNLDQIKKASKHLIEGGKILNRKSGLEDKAKWKSLYRTLDDFVLEKLYDTASNLMANDPLIQSTPSKFIDSLFYGNTKEEQARNIARILLGL